MPASAERSVSVKRKTSSAGQLSKKVPCNVCGRTISRASDVGRHLKTHDSTAKKHPCRWEGCGFKTLQKSNLKTHYRTHTQEKPFICSDDPGYCIFRTGDPASLLRHRKRLHNYIPGSSKSCKTGNLIPPQYFPSGESETVTISVTSPRAETHALMSYTDSSPHHQEGLPFSSSPLPFDYIWDNDMSFLYELGFFNSSAADSESGPSIMMNGPYGWFGPPLYHN